MINDAGGVLFISILFVALSIVPVFLILRKSSRQHVGPASFFSLSLLLKAYFIFYLSMVSSGPSAPTALLILSIAFLIDYYIIGKILDDYFDEKHVFILFAPVVLGIAVETGLANKLGSEQIAFLTTNLLILFGLLLIALFQLRVLNISWRLTGLSRGLFKAATYFTLAVSALLLMKEATTLDPYYFLGGLDPYFFLYASALLQVVPLGLYFSAKAYKRYQKMIQTNNELGIWNMTGFIQNAEDIRTICARLDQNVTLAMFKIENNSTIKAKMNENEFKNFRKGVVNSFRFSLRKHDEMGLIDENIFAVLLPFTDLQKGEIACKRLGESAKRAYLAKGQALDIDFGLTFGVTLVRKKEPNVLEALKRAATALSQAEPFSVVPYKETMATLTSQTKL